MPLALFAKPIDKDRLLRVMSTMVAKRANWPDTSMVAEDDLSGETPDN